MRHTEMDKSKQNLCDRRGGLSHHSCAPSGASEISSVRAAFLEISSLREYGELFYFCKELKIDNKQSNK